LISFSSHKLDPNIYKICKITFSNFLFVLSAHGCVLQRNNVKYKLNKKKEYPMSDDTVQQMNFNSNGIAVSQLQEWDQKHFIHPWAEISPTKPNFGLIAEGKGIYLYDHTGKKYIDGPGGMWCVNVGYGRKEIASAVADQLLKLPYASPWTSTTEPATILSKRIAEKTPGDLNNVFFSTCGSTAVDTAIRFVHFSNNVLNKKNKKIVIAREKGYHGSTYLSASISGKERDKRDLDTNTEFVRFLPDINPYMRPSGIDLEAWCNEKVADLESCIIEAGAENVAAFIAEPILASGGVIIPPEGYHRKTLEICRKYDILYISDEVVTGFGRLGHWFASEKVFGIIPDIITCAKGLTSGYMPMGATIISDRLMKSLSDQCEDSTLFSHGFTYSGHPAAAAAANKNIDLIEKEEILAHVREVTPFFQKRLKILGQKYDIIGDARGIGLLGCLEGNIGEGLTQSETLDVDYKFGELIDAATEKRGLLVRPIINMCVFSPPLIITKKEIDDMFDILDEALNEVQSKLIKSKN
jgi:adenosylmethionine-8-amino-7-oxononanoate aminotransferase